MIIRKKTALKKVGEKVVSFEAQTHTNEAKIIVNWSKKKIFFDTTKIFKKIKIKLNGINLIEIITHNDYSQKNCSKKSRGKGSVFRGSNAH